MNRIWHEENGFRPDQRREFTREKAIGGGVGVRIQGLNLRNRAIFFVIHQTKMGKGKPLSREGQRDYSRKCYFHTLSRVVPEEVECQERQDRADQKQIASAYLEASLVGHGQET